MEHSLVLQALDNKAGDKEAACHGQQRRSQGVADEHLEAVVVGDERCRRNAADLQSIKTWGIVGTWRCTWLPRVETRRRCCTAYVFSG